MKVASHLLSINSSQIDFFLKQAMQDCYEHKHGGYDFGAKKYPISGELSAINESLQTHEEWCEMVDIRGTPPIFINGQRIAWLLLTREDIRYFS